MEGGNAVEVEYFCGIERARFHIGQIIINGVTERAGGAVIARDGFEKTYHRADNLIFRGFHESVAEREEFVKKGLASALLIALERNDIDLVSAEFAPILHFTLEYFFNVFAGQVGDGVILVADKNKAVSAYRGHFKSDFRVFYHFLRV